MRTVEVKIIRSSQGFDCKGKSEEELDEQYYKGRNAVDDDFCSMVAKLIAQGWKVAGFTDQRSYAVQTRSALMVRERPSNTHRGPPWASLTRKS